MQFFSVVQKDSEKSVGSLCDQFLELGFFCWWTKTCMGKCKQNFMNPHQTQFLFMAFQWLLQADSHPIIFLFSRPRSFLGEWICSFREVERSRKLCQSQDEAHSHVRHRVMDGSASLISPSRQITKSILRTIVNEWISMCAIADRRAPSSCVSVM